jgi:hypothetical protein
MKQNRDPLAVLFFIADLGTIATWKNKSSLLLETGK